MDIQAFKDCKPVVGQTVFVAEYNQRKRIYDSGKCSVITKVGRKYFEVDKVKNGRTPIKFFNDSKHSDSQYSGSPKLYPSQEAFEAELLLQKTKSAVRNQVHGVNGMDLLDLDEVQAIADILSKKYDLKL